ncbi:MAG: inorganic diphosphatase [Firmicutes bacterium]|nr:inorganic diphosphatase [Bacillota bacterium]
MKFLHEIVEITRSRMLKADAEVSELTPDQIARDDLKEFEVQGKVISISQVLVMDTGELLAQKKHLLAGC